MTMTEILKEKDSAAKLAEILQTCEKKGDKITPAKIEAMIDMAYLLTVDEKPA